MIFIRCSNRFKNEGGGGGWQIDFGLDHRVGPCFNFNETINKESLHFWLH